MTRNGPSHTDTTAAERCMVAKLEEYSLRKKPADKTTARTRSSAPEGKTAKLKNKEFEGHLAKLQTELLTLA